MGEQTFWDKVRDSIGGMAFRVFLWSNRMTDEQYFAHVFEIESQRREENHAD